MVVFSLINDLKSQKKQIFVRSKICIEIIYGFATFHRERRGRQQEIYTWCLKRRPFRIFRTYWMIFSKTDFKF